MDSNHSSGHLKDSGPYVQQFSDNEPNSKPLNSTEKPNCIPVSSATTANHTNDVEDDAFHDINQELFASQLRDFVDAQREQFSQMVSAQLSTMTEEFIEKTLSELPTVSNQSSKLSPQKQRHRSGKFTDDDTVLPIKVFHHRNSVLTDLLRISHIRTVYHIFVAILIIFSLNTMLSDWTEYGGIIHTYHLELVVWAFGNMKDVVMIWLMMKASTIAIVYPAYLQWSTGRPNPCHRAINYDFFWFGLMIFYQIVFLIVPLSLVYYYQLPPASSVMVVAEQIRMMMKSYAFIRENVPRVIYNKPKSQDDQVTFDKSKDLNNEPCPNFSYYLYFLFAPTLVYCNIYPRSPRIRWRYVVSNFAQVFFCIVYMYYVLARFCFVNFLNFNKDHITPKQLVISAFGCMLPGGLVLLITFFAVLHSWLNAFAEMMRFGDRLFYKDWWTATSFGAYYRTWNVVVHDWLYSYVYRDVYQSVRGPARRAVATASVFLLSAVFHEYVLIVTFRFFYPVLFVMFAGAGFGFIFIKGHSRYWNVALWLALFIGTGLLMCLYSMEWYARKNCAMHFSWYVDYLLPRSWFCYNQAKN